MINKSFFLVFFVVVLCNFSHAALSIDTNQFSTNSNLKITTEPKDLFLSEDGSISNKLKSVIEPELPNSYLATGRIEYPVPETMARRFDVVYFIAVPAAFTLTLNLLIIVNNLYNNSRSLNDSDWEFIYVNTLVVPFSVAYYDNLYVNYQKVLKEKFSYNTIKDNLRFDLPLICYRF